MKICIFADAHFSDTNDGIRECTAALEKIKKVISANADCDLLVSMGDIIDGTGSAKNDLALLERANALLDSSGKPVLSVLGNHDAFSLPKHCFGEVDAHEGIGCARVVSKNGASLVFLDAEFFEGDLPYDGTPGDWTDSVVPAAQLNRLEQALAEAEGKVYVFCHQRLDGLEEPRDGHVVKNAAAVRSVIEKSGKVSAVLQGHYHPGCESVINQIPYHTVAALCNAGACVYTVLDTESGSFTVSDAS